METKCYLLQKVSNSTITLLRSYFYTEYSASISDKVPSATMHVGKQLKEKANHVTHTFPMTAKTAEILSNFLAKPQTVINNHILTNESNNYNLLPMHYLSAC